MRPDTVACTVMLQMGGWTLLKVSDSNQIQLCEKMIRRSTLLINKSEAELFCLNNIYYRIMPINNIETAFFISK